MENLWAKYAGAYAKVLPHVSFYAESVNKMIESVEGKKKVLDIGCGPGIISEKLVQRHEVTAIDSDEIMLDYARNKLGSSRVIKMDAQELNFKDRTFDAAVCNNVLYYVDKPDSVIKQATRVLKYGGIFSVSGPNRGYNPQILFEQMLSDLDKSGLSTIFAKDIEVIIECNKALLQGGIKNPFDNNELEGQLLSEGLEIIKSERIYLGQCYFISAQKKKPTLNQVLSDNPILSGKISISGVLSKKRSGHYEMGVVDKPEDAISVFNLRHRAYTKAKMYESPIPNGLDFDMFDRNSVIFYAKDTRTNEMVCTVRLILDSEDGLYMETSYDLSNFRQPNMRLAEGSRLAADPPGIQVSLSDEGEYNLSDIVLNMATQFASNIGVTHILGLSRVKLQEFFASNGYYPMNGKVQPVSMGDGRISQGQALYPVVLDTSIPHPVPKREHALIA